MWKYLGVVEMNEEFIKPNIVKNKFLSSVYYQKFNKDLRMYFYKIEKKNTPISIDDSDENRIMKQSAEFEDSEPKKKVKENP